MSLDPVYVWIDCMAFDHVAHHPDMSDRASLQRALNLYLGHFLEGETSSWALTFRERLRVQYISMAERFGTLLEQESDWSNAVECYLRAIEVEPMAEVFYCRLMNVYSPLGRCADAMAVYQRCRQSLDRRPLLGLRLGDQQRHPALHHRDAPDSALKQCCESP